MSGGGDAVRGPRRGWAADRAAHRLGGRAVAMAGESRLLRRERLASLGPFGLWHVDGRRGRAGWTPESRLQGGLGLAQVGEWGKLCPGMRVSEVRTLSPPGKGWIVSSAQTCGPKSSFYWKRAGVGGEGDETLPKSDRGHLEGAQGGLSAQHTGPRGLNPGRDTSGEGSSFFNCCGFLLVRSQEWSVRWDGSDPR